MDMTWEGEGEEDKVKAVIFKAGLDGYRHHEKMLEINPSKSRIGQSVMTEEERGALEKKREEEARKEREDRKWCQFRSLRCWVSHYPLSVKRQCAICSDHVLSMFASFSYSQHVLSTSLSYSSYKQVSDALNVS